MPKIIAPFGDDCNRAVLHRPANHRMVNSCSNPAVDSNATVLLRRQRLQQAVDELFGGNRSALARAVGKVPSQVSDMIDGRKSFGEKVARDIEAKLAGDPWHMAAGWLDRASDALSPDGKNDVTLHPVARPSEPASPPDWQDFGEPLRLPPARAVPVVGTAQLGDNGHYVELEYPVGTGDGAVLALTSDPNAYAVRCRGDSMQPRLQHGEFAVIEPNHEVAPGDEVLVKSRDGRVMIKRLRYQRDGRIYLDSVNDATHPPVILETSDVAALHYVAAIVKSAYYRPA